MEEREKKLKIQISEKKGISIFATVLISIAPMISQYSSFFKIVSMPELLLAPVVIICLLSKNKLLLYNTNMIVYFFIIILFSLINMLYRTTFDESLFFTTVIRYAYYFIIVIFVIRKLFAIEIGAKTVVILASLNSLYGLMQLLWFNLFRVALPWHIPFLELRTGNKLVEFQEHYFLSYGYRFSGLFSEPAQYSLYIGIAYMIVLFYKEGKLVGHKGLKVLLLLLFTSVMLLSGAGAGFGLLFVIWGIYFFHLIFGSSSLTRTRLKGLVCLPALAVGFFAIQLSPTLIRGLSRIANISETSSLMIRVLRPWIVYGDLPIIHKLIGVGYANYSNYVFNNSQAITYEINTGVAWANSIGFIAVGTGLIGLCLYITIFANFYRRGNVFSRVMIFFLFVIGLYSSAHHSITLLTMMAIVSSGLTGLEQKKHIKIESTIKSAFDSSEGET